MTPQPAGQPDPYAGQLESPALLESQGAQSYRDIYGERYEKLPIQIVDYLRETIKRLAAQNKYLRFTEIMRDRKLRFYINGVQHVYPTNGGGYAVATPGGSIPSASGQQSIQCGEYLGNYDITSVFLRIITATLTQGEVSVPFDPKNPSSSQDQEAATAAEAYWQQFKRNNDMGLISQEIIRMMGTSGRVVSWTRTESDAEKYGLNPDGSARNIEVATVYGCLEHKCPVLAKDFGACLYNIIYDDPDVLECKALYGDQEDATGKKLKPSMKPNSRGIGEDEYERMLRIGVLQGAKRSIMGNDLYTNIATRANCWLRPAACAGEEADVEYTGPEFATIGEAVKALFPSGVHAVFVGDVYVGSWDESVDDALDIQFSKVGDGMSRVPILEPIIQIQDDVNDLLNTFHSVTQMGWPSTWMAVDAVAFRAIQKQIAAPYAFRMFDLQGKADDIRKLVFREQDPVIPPTFYELLQFLQGPFAEFLLGCPPSLWGAPLQDVKTASGQNQQVSQAQGQQGLWYGRIKKMVARIAYQAALCAAKNPDYAQGIDNDDGTKTSLAMISKERFGAYPDQDSDFPESAMQQNQKLDAVLEFAATNPEVGGAMLQEPMNWKIILQRKGVPGLVIPQGEAADAAQYVIEHLLATGEMLNAPSADGLPPEPLMAPTIQPDPLSYHEWEFDYCRSWINSAKARQLAKTNPMGVQNVRLYALAQQALIPLPPMPMAPGGTPTQAQPAAPMPEAPPAAPTA
jgi:hypothetical protein